MELTQISGQSFAGSYTQLIDIFHCFRQMEGGNTEPNYDRKNQSRGSSFRTTGMLCPNPPVDRSLTRFPAFSGEVFGS